MDEGWPEKEGRRRKRRISCNKAQVLLHWIERRNHRHGTSSEADPVQCWFLWTKWSTPLTTSFHHRTITGWPRRLQPTRTLVNFSHYYWMLLTEGSPDKLHGQKQLPVLPFVCIVYDEGVGRFVIPFFVVALGAMLKGKYDWLTNHIWTKSRLHFITLLLLSIGWLSNTTPKKYLGGMEMERPFN